MSSIIKSPFVSFAEQKKKIEVVSNKDRKIINNHPIKKDPGIFEETDVEAFDKVEQSTLHHEQSHKNALEHHQERMDEAYEDMMAGAMQEADALIEQAREEILRLENEAKEKGKKEGFKQGKEEALRNMGQMQEDLEAEIEAFHAEKSEFYTNIEPKMAHIIQTLVSNMIGIQKFDKDTILFVIRKGLEEVDVQGDIIIKVSPIDFDEVMQHKATIEENLSSQSHLEILKDAKLQKNDCIIETNLGNINCSLQDRLNGLLRQLNLIEKSFGSN